MCVAIVRMVEVGHGRQARCKPFARVRACVDIPLDASLLLFAPPANYGDDVGSGDTMGCSEDVSAPQANSGDPMRCSESMGVRRSQRFRRTPVWRIFRAGAPAPRAWAVSQKGPLARLTQGPYRPEPTRAAASWGPLLAEYRPSIGRVWVEQRPRMYGVYGRHMGRVYAHRRRV